MFSLSFELYIYIFVILYNVESLRSPNAGFNFYAQNKGTSLFVGRKCIPSLAPWPILLLSMSPPPILFYSRYGKKELILYSHRRVILRTVGFEAGKVNKSSSQRGKCSHSTNAFQAISEVGGRALRQQQKELFQPVLIFTSTGSRKTSSIINRICFIAVFKPIQKSLSLKALKFQLYFQVKQAEFLVKHKSKGKPPCKPIWMSFFLLEKMLSPYLVQCVCIQQLAQWLSSFLQS